MDLSSYDQNISEIKAQIFYEFYMYLCYPTQSGQRHIQIQLLGLEGISNKRIKILSVHFR